jgi:hypothetical protein
MVALEQLRARVEEQAEELEDLNNQYHGIAREYLQYRGECEGRPEAVENLRNMLQIERRMRKKDGKRITNIAAERNEALARIDAATRVLLEIPGDATRQEVEDEIQRAYEILTNRK